MKNVLNKKPLIQKEDAFDRTILPNTYHSSIQKTPAVPIIKQEGLNIQIEKSEEDDKIIETQNEINSLISHCKELDQQIAQHDQQQREQLNDEILAIHNQTLDDLIGTIADKNQLLSMMQGYENSPQIGFDFQKEKDLISALQQAIQIEQQNIAKKNAEIEELKKQDMKQKQELALLDQKLTQNQAERNQRKIIILDLQKKSKQKSFEALIQQEQYYIYTKKIRTYCIFHSKKQNDDQSYSNFVIIQNKKKLIFDHSLNIPFNQWVSSKKKKKCQPYKFENIFQNTSKESYLQFYRSIEIFIKSTLYKQIDQVFNEYECESEVFKMMFEGDLIENIKNIKQNCEKETLYPHQVFSFVNLQKQIVLLSDENGGLVGQFVRDVSTSLKTFSNQILQVTDLTLTLQKFNIKDRQCEVISECNVDDIEMMIDCLESKDIFVNGQHYLRMDIQVNNNQKRYLHILMLTPMQIENNELFCQQFKSVFRRQKASKEQLGSKVYSIIKNCDNYLIVTQIPEMVCLNGNQANKISVVENIVNFQSLLRSKQNK